MPSLLDATTVAAPLAPTPFSAPSASQAVSALIDAIGEPRFAHQGLAALNGPLQVASWSVYSLHAQRAPVLHLSAAQGVSDQTHACFDAYQAGLYRRDHSFDGVRRAARPGHAAVLRMREDQAPNAEHRELIYRRHGLAERLSVAALEDDGSVLAVNLYHHAHQGDFSEAEATRFADMATLVLASVRRHVRLAGALKATAASAAATAIGEPATAADPLPARAAMSQACPALTPRELDVCERLLRGWSHDGVAADLGLSLATVKTYRARAFSRLGLHFRSELFARFGAQR